MWRRCTTGMAGVLCFFFYLAFILPRICLRLGAWWRIPLITDVAPDAHLYFLWLGAVVRRLPLGEFFFWLIPVFRVLSATLARGWSIPELALLIFCLAIAGTCWIFPGTVRAWTGLQIRQTALVCACFLSVWVLILGFRPGVYSWYAPGLLLGLWACARAWQRLEERRWFRATTWGALGLFATWMYPWFFLFALSLLSIGAMLALTGRRWRSIAVYFFVLSVIACLSSIGLAFVLIQPAFRPLIDQYARAGTWFSHMPYVTNTLFLIIGWIVLYGYVLRRSPLLAALSGVDRFEFPSLSGVDNLPPLVEGGRGEHSLWLMLTSWIILCVLWLDYPLTGLFLYNEHFVSLVILLGGISLAWVLGTPTSPLTPLLGKERGTGSIDRTSLSLRRRWTEGEVVFLLPSLWFLYELAHAFRPGASILQYNLGIISWGLLALAALSLILPRMWVRRIGVSLAVMLTVWAYAALVQRETKAYPEALSYAPIIDWINHDTPATTRYCTDVESAAVLGAHTGRLYYPSEGTIVARETTEAYDRRLEALAGAFDVRASGQYSTWRYYYVNFGFGQTCDSFPVQISLLRRAHVSDLTINAISGCPVELLKQRDARFARAISEPFFPREPLKNVCARVIIADRLRQAWHLPAHAALIDRVPGFEIWNLP